MNRSSVMLLSVFFVHVCILLAAAVDRFDALGFGVRPNDGIFASRHLKFCALNLRSMKASLAGYSTRTPVNVQNVHIRTDEKTTAKDFDEFPRRIRGDLSNSAKLMILQASLTTHYRFISTQRKDYYFARKTSVVDRAQLRINGASATMLRSRLIHSVANFLRTQSPNRIFQSYGTHVTTGSFSAVLLSCGHHPGPRASARSPSSSSPSMPASRKSSRARHPSQCSSPV